jgi:hypothetical protein
MRPAYAMPARPAGTALGTAHETDISAWPTWRQGSVDAQSRGSGGQPDFGADHQRGGLGMTVRATWLHGELD